MSPSSPSQKPKKIIIFDFDGVLADTFDTFYPLMRDVMKCVDLSLTPNQYRNFFTGNVHKSIKNFINNKKKYEAAMKFRNSNYDKYYNNRHSGAKLFIGTIEFLKKINKSYILTVASSGRVNNIINLLERNRVKNLFSLVIANSDTSKAGMIKEILGKFDKKAEASIMITDTVGDIKIAKKLGLKTIAVEWGFHNAKTLKQSKPSCLVNNFNELFYKLTRL